MKQLTITQDKQGNLRLSRKAYTNDITEYFNRVYKDLTDKQHTFTSSYRRWCDSMSNLSKSFVVEVSQEDEQFDPSQCQGLEVEDALEQLLTEEISSEEEEDQPCEQQSNTSTTQPVKKRTAKEMMEERNRTSLPIPPPHIQQTKRTRKSANNTEQQVPVITALDVIMENSQIRLDSYGLLYSKFTRSEKSGKMDSLILQVIHSLLLIIGTLVNTSTINCQTLLTAYLTPDRVNSLSMIVLSASQRTKLKNWLKEFIVVEEDRKLEAVTENKASPSLATTLPGIPTNMNSRMSMSFMTVPGKNTSAGVGHSKISHATSDSEEEPEKPELYKPKMSSTLCSMSYVSGKFRYSARSKGMCGSNYIKLEMYDGKKVRNVPSQEWWKHANFKAFVPISNKTELMGTINQVAEGIRELIENQPDVEADFVRVKSSNS